MTLSPIRSLTPVTGGARDLTITAALDADHHPVHTPPPGPRHVTPEQLDRVKTALRNTDLPYPTTPVTVEGDLPTGGGHPIHDLAVAIAVLTAAGGMPRLDDTVVVGALGLDGSVRPAVGIRQCLLALRNRTDVRRVIIPGADLVTAPTLDHVAVLGADTVADVVAYARGRRDALIPALSLPPPAACALPPFLDGLVLSPWVARGLAAPAAGGHHVLLTGPDPDDRSLFAHALTALLPALTDEQAFILAENRRYGGPADSTPPDHLPPYRAAHRDASLSSLIGSSRGPGAALLATYGVLHLPDAGGRPREQWEELWQLIDSREVILPVNGTPTFFTADPLLVLSMEGLPSQMRQVPPMIYDRVSVRLHVTRTDHHHRPDQEPPSQEPPGQDGPDDKPLDGDMVALPVLARTVAAARLRAARRWLDTGVSTNAEVPEDALAAGSVLPRASCELLDRHHRAGVLSERGVDEVRRLAWSLADLDACPRPEPRHVEQAVALRLQCRPASR
ncbi:ATP-binding protein [Saccharothrix xinjiangensis]|uniref:ATP-binding protein n=1 Tax=Saccharothrix xinjiangensis TaxID=204798 RepID=UPI0031DD494C